MATQKETWIAKLAGHYSAGTHSCFIVSGNVRDSGVGDVRGMALRFGAANFDMTLLWDRADGLRIEGNAEKVQAFKAQYLKATDPFTGAPADIDPASVRGAEQALGLLSAALAATSSKILVAIDYAESVFPDGPMSQLQETDRKAVVQAQAWGYSREIAQAGHLIMLIARTSSALHADIRNATTHYAQVLVPYPTYDERLAFLQERADAGMAEETLTFREVATITSGLNLLQLDDIIMAAEKQEQGLTRELIREHKDAIIAGEFSEVLEPMYPSYGFEALGGMEPIKAFFRKNVIEPMRTGNTARVPAGILMAGAPGTGKTICAEAVMHEAKINGVKLNLARVFGRYVGDSERNLERAIEGIISMAPTIVFLDEIDQQIRRGEGGDSGVSNRVFARIMEFMSDTSYRGKVIFLAATNRPDLLDPALKRPGRFDKKVPFLPPITSGEREAILHAFEHKYHTPATFSEQLLEQTAGWSGAELEALFIKGVEIGQDQGSVAAQLDAAFAVYLPSLQDVESMTEAALAETSDLSLVPEAYWPRVRALRARSMLER